ncbi:NAD-dependent deacylase [Corynebacterium uropygiale]|uniref:NAD-dependent protein deacylase n=1 Tax=Corynebacterium uropygiale TaxID=1775911 RepID=A0A9X1TX18_9CORY|nr:NAD-dependent deacylase [Corynebacterium uropygiale]MCF4005585.1 NAD-dependent deacylase [Corynebacterium uropygiale]
MRDQQLEHALDLCRGARRINVFTGAGMSAESGLDTYRDATTGVWSHVDPQAMASIDAWARDPEPMWAWYLWRAALSRHADPNAGHRALAAWEQLPGVEAITITTQNIDDLHERGGSSEIIHLHGSLFDYRCTICSRPWRGGVSLPLVPDDDTPAHPAGPSARLRPPRCPLCGNLIRPGVVWFGEPLPEREWDAAERAMASADLVLIVGTSGVVFPAAGLPRIAAELGTPILEISPEPTDLTRLCDYSWRSTAATGLPALVDALAGLS